MYHYRTTMQRYRQHRRSAQDMGDCVFCSPMICGTFVEEAPLSYVVPNQTFYDLWEGRQVIDHLMVLPKRHVTTLADLTTDESAEIMRTIGRYEADGYNVYARAIDSVSRSQPHQHTHLIKTAHETSRGVFYLEKPYIVIRL